MLPAGSPLKRDPKEARNGPCQQRNAPDEDELPLSVLTAISGTASRMQCACGSRDRVWDGGLYSPICRGDCTPHLTRARGPLPAGSGCVPRGTAAEYDGQRSRTHFQVHAPISPAWGCSRGLSLRPPPGRPGRGSCHLLHAGSLSYAPPDDTK